MNNLFNISIGLPCTLCASCLFRVNIFFTAHPDNYRGTEYTEKAQNNLSKDIKSSVYSPCDLCILCEHFFKAQNELNYQYIKETPSLAAVVRPNNNVLDSHRIVYTTGSVDTAKDLLPFSLIRYGDPSQSPDFINLLFLGTIVNRLLLSISQLRMTVAKREIAQLRKTISAA